MSESPDPDLRDVFRLLYADDDWAFSDDGDPEEGPVDVEDHPPLNTIAPEIEVELVESDLASPPPSSEKYTRKRYFEALDSLLSHTSQPASPSSSSSSKRKRIYNPPPKERPSSSSSSIIPSTQPIPSLPDYTSYAPYSPLALLSRLRSFHPYTYSSLYPDELSPVTAALHGWTNVGREGLKCHSCGEEWGLGGLTDIENEKIRLEVAKRLAKGFEARHKPNCAWRIRSSPNSLHSQLRNHLHPALSSSLAPLAERMQRDVLVSTSSAISWSSPVDEKAQDSLRKALHTHLGSHETTLTTLAVALAFFAWYPYYPNDPSSTSVTPSTAKEPTDIVSCRICQRRVGLWSFVSTEKKQDDAASFDLVKEHVEWCPSRPRIGEREWWLDLPILRGSAKATDERVRDLVLVSEKLESKPWRRAR